MQPISLSSTWEQGCMKTVIMSCVALSCQVVSVAKQQVSGLNWDWNYKIWMHSCLSAGVKISLNETAYYKILEIDLSEYGVAFNT